VFYREYAVADTVSGRLDMIVLHLVLVMRRLATLGEAAGTGRLLFEAFCQDIDDNFREMGVGDLAVPKEMRRVAEQFYGRANAYQRALDAGDSSALEAAVARNVFGNATPHLGARRLAAYMQDAARRLDREQSDALVHATFKFPDPGRIDPPVRPDP
jgi:cytochrome b pre-mRNA-processing protein 3